MWRGDGICDAGGRVFQEKFIHLDCYENDNNYDNGDCVVDCNGNSAPAAWVGDGECDSATLFNGQTIVNLECPELDCDGNDCSCDGSSKSLSLSVLTDLDGRYVQSLPAGQYSVLVESDGCESKTVNVHLPWNDSGLTGAKVDVTLNCKC
jgi:hypothetical protein